jgi:hypothetical protein
MAADALHAPALARWRKFYACTIGQRCASLKLRHAVGKNTVRVSESGREEDRLISKKRIYFVFDHAK